MKLSLAFVLVSSLGILTLLAEKIPQYEARQAATSNEDAPGTYRGISLKRGIFGLYDFLYALRTKYDTLL